MNHDQIAVLYVREKLVSDFVNATRPMLGHLPPLGPLGSIELENGVRALIDKHFQLSWTDEARDLWGIA